MTTAHRATWKAARGGLQEEGSFRLHVPSAAVSSKDAPTEANLKTRARTDIAPEGLRDRSGNVAQPLPKRQRKSRFGPASELQLAAQKSPNANEAHNNEPDEKSITRHEQRDTALQEPTELVTHSDRGSDGGSDGGSDDESDDDEAELLAELENIRKERAYERAKKREEKQTQHENQTTMNSEGTNFMCATQRDAEFSETASVATGSMPGFAVRRRWNEDVVFRNDIASDRSKEQRFINDTIRNDYHRRFMKRHIK